MIARILGTIIVCALAAAFVMARAESHKPMHVTYHSRR